MSCDNGWSDYLCAVMMGGVTRCDDGWESLDVSCDDG